jgi:hypothetical protein
MGLLGASYLYGVSRLRVKISIVKNAIDCIAFYMIGERKDGQI